MVTLRPQLAAWQCYISLIRVFTTIYLIIYWGWMLGGTRYLISDTKSFFSEHESTFSQSRLESELQYYRSWIIRSACWIVSATLFLLNDIFMLTADRKRTNTYLGCLVTQVAVNSCFSGLSILHIVEQARWDMFTDFNSYPQDGVLAVSVPLSELCSLCLLGICLWPVVALRSYMPMKQLWKTNTKDAFGLRGEVLSKVELGVLGHPRETTREIALPGPLATIYGTVKRQLAHLFFRRIRPVETRLYAFTRNAFATAAIAMLIFRTVTALQQAQNEVETRITSTTCEDASPSHNISILLDRVIYDSRWGTSLPEDVNITVSAVWNTAGRSYAAYKSIGCTLEWTQGFKGKLYPNYGSTQNRSLEFFSCPTDGWLDRGKPPTEEGFSDIFSYRIEVQSSAMVFDGQIPRIWLVNLAEFSKPPDHNWSAMGEIRAYLPPLKLSRGSNITAEANLITRRFIRSSIVKDIILHFKPNYRRLSLYPIVESSVAALNSSDINIATATIRPTLSPGLMYHRNQVTIDNSDPSELPSNVCDYIEDYRTGTFIDVIGSVGGLFALLQAAHLLLFGRPLLWGLTGAKTITPFGLLGGCSSRGFRRRLRDEYHSQSGEDGADTIRIVKFLRDFVIDFGPADLDVECTESSRTSAELSSEETIKRDPTDTHIPLTQIASDETNELEEECDAGEGIHTHRNDRDRSKPI